METGGHTGNSIAYTTFHSDQYRLWKSIFTRFFREFSGTFNPGTLRLLNTGTRRALTMMVRAHVAFLLAGLGMDLPVYVAIGLGTYAIYTLDNTIGGVEDDVNGKDFRDANKDVAILAVSLAFLACIILMALNGLLAVPLFPIAISLVYSKGLAFGNNRLRLKEGGYGIKNLVIGISKGWAIAAAILLLGGNPAAALLVFFFFGMKSCIVSTLNDLADVAGDARAGIRTLPRYLGVAWLKALLVALTLISYAAIALGSATGVLAGPPFILAYSLAASVAAIAIYDPAWHYSRSWLRRNLRALLTDGEFIVPILIMCLI